MTVALFAYDPALSLVTALIFVLVYGTIFHLLKHRLLRTGEAVTAAYKVKQRTMVEGFGGIKDILLLRRQSVFVHTYSAAATETAISESAASIMAQVPKNAVEFVAFGTVITLIVLTVAGGGDDLVAIMPKLSIYALAGFKLMPAMQAAYSAAAQVRANLPSFRAISDDLTKAFSIDEAARDHERGAAMPLTETVALRGASFTYPSRAEPSAWRVDVEIRAGLTYAFVGSSGSGKSTTADILVGLINPDEGVVVVDGVELCPDNVRRWQRSVSVVPQHIFLVEGSIRENITLLSGAVSYDEKRFEDAIKAAQLTETLSKLPDGFDTQVGERGVQLSGGQRQRIGIARALYREASLLILDEATSALDTITEERFLRSLKLESRNRTVLMIAHRMSTIRMCDRIYVFDHGRVVGSGTFDELLAGNPHFRALAAQGTR